MSTKIQLLPGESVVMSSDQDILTLTTKRVRYYDSSISDKSSFISITLDSVSSCGLTTKSNLNQLILGAAIALVSISADGIIQGAILLIAVLFISAYIFTRQAVIIIASSGGQTIQVPIKRMGRSSVVEFLEAIEREKLNNANIRN